MPKDTIVPRKKRPDIPTVGRLLDTSALLFWDKGYAATTTREIASALDIQQASLYYHISSKEDLLHQLCISSLQEFLTTVPAALEGVSGQMERIRVLIRAHVRTLLAHQERNAAMLTELRSLSPRRRTEVVALREKYLNIVRSLIEPAQATGMMRSDISTTYLSLALLNILNWICLWFRKDQALSADPLAEIFLDIYLNGVALPEQHRAIQASGKPRKIATRARKTTQESTNPTVERLLRAAVALFSRKGYTATSTREVAALLGMQKASLYYHIQGKEDLLYFICRSSLERIKNDVDAAISDVTDPIERIRVLIVAHMESMLRDADDHSTTLAEMHALSTERRAQVWALRDAYEELVRSVLRDGQNAGVLREDIDVKYICLGLLGLMNRVLVWYRRRGALSPAQLGDLLAAMFLSGAAAPISR